MDGLWLADIEIALIHTLINMLLMYRSKAVQLSTETCIGSTAALSAMLCVGIGLCYKGYELVLTMVLMKMIICLAVMITTHKRQ